MVMFVPFESSSYADQSTVSPKVTLKVSSLVVSFTGLFMVMLGGIVSTVKYVYPLVFIFPAVSLHQNVMLYRPSSRFETFAEK